MRRRLLSLVAAVLVTAGCTQASVEPSPVSPLASAPSSVVPAGNLPPGCEPIELRTTTGVRVDLNGVWVQEAAGNLEPMTWWVESFGDCLWATGIADYYDYGESVSATLAHAVQTVRGTIGTDFTVAGTAVLLAPHDCVCLAPRVAEVTFDIVIDDAGGIRLEEDREAGVAGPRCVDPSSYCPPPLVLRQLE
jgi:hypothetical protein